MMSFPEFVSGRLMTWLRHQRRAVVSAVMILLLTGTADAQVHRAVIHSHRPAALPGYWTHDIHIDFAGQYTGSQMIVELTSGSIYHLPILGTDTPPNPALFAVAPTVEWDTFVANGGPTTTTTVGNFVLGGAAINVDEHRGGGPQRNAVFSDSEIDQAWNPAGGNEIIDHEGFLVARVTLSDDSNGTFRYLASANQVFGPQEVTVVIGDVRRTYFGGERGITLPIVNGCFICVPEPSTLALLGVGLALPLAARGRWR